jgi:hypothetical protein
MDVIRAEGLLIKTLYITIVFLLITSCLPPGSNAAKDTNGTGNTNDIKQEDDNNKGNVNNGNKEGEPQENYPVLRLSAAVSSGSAYPVIAASGFDYETPGQANGGHTGVPHILQQYDEILGKNVFAFVMHHDTDRSVTGDWTRQRTEIKIDHRNNINNPGRDFCALGGADEGRSFIYRWKFKLPTDFAVSNEFTHIHQIKNEGGDSSQPVITLTARRVGTQRRMQLIYRAPTFGFGGTSPENSPMRYLAGNSGNSLDDYLGEWVSCEVHIVYSSDPEQAAYSIKVTRMRDNRVLLDYTHSNVNYAAIERDPGKWQFVTWRTGNTHGRPKFGLYRRIFSGSNPGNFTEPDASRLVHGLKDETILYADFEIVRVK